MKLKSRALGALAGLLAVVALGGTATAADRAYSEGPVSVVTSLRVEPGQFNNYMNYLSNTYKPMMEEAKKAGHILGYAVYTTRARSADDPDMYLVVTYKNMAAFDGLSDRMEAIQEKMIGNQDQRDAATIARGKMRTMVGSEVIQQMILK